jgi:hypothetical protein
MMHALQRVDAALPRTTRMFALGARDASAATKRGVTLAISQSLDNERYRLLVDSVPRVLRQTSKPYDADFPVVPCIITVPFRNWKDCWYWLVSRFGENVHSTTDESQQTAGVARASISLASHDGWVVKARLYFDFNRLRCNVVPMALAPSLSFENDYPAGSRSHSVFGVLQRAATPTTAHPSREEAWLGLARARTFCDSLLALEFVLGALSGLVQRENLALCSNDDISIQFGPSVAAQCSALFTEEFRPIGRAGLLKFLDARASSGPKGLLAMSDSDRLVSRCRNFLKTGMATLAMQALFNDLGMAVGADNPAEYSLQEPFSPTEIEQDPYLRLRLGFTFGELISLFRESFDGSSVEKRPVELLVSELVDAFIDHGAIVPTIMRQGEACTRVYRKGEANPRWDEEFARLSLAIKSLSEKDRRELSISGRTRVAKIAAIMALSSQGNTALRVGALERGNVGMLVRSVVERDDEEITGIMRRIGMWPA